MENEFSRPIVYLNHLSYHSSTPQSYQKKISHKESLDIVDVCLSTVSRSYADVFKFFTSVTVGGFLAHRPIFDL
jgi:hypothetical protein